MSRRSRPRSVGRGTFGDVEPASSQPRRSDSPPVERLRAVRLLRRPARPPGLAGEEHPRLPAQTGGAPGTPRMPNRRWRLRRRQDFSPRLDVDALAERAEQAPWCTLANDDLFLERDGPAFPAPDACPLLYEVFYTADSMRALFPGAEIRPPASPSR